MAISSSAFLISALERSCWALFLESDSWSFCRLSSPTVLCRSATRSSSCRRSASLRVSRFWDWGMKEIDLLNINYYIRIFHHNIILIPHPGFIFFFHLILTKSTIQKNSTHFLCSWTQNINFTLHLQLHYTHTWPCDIWSFSYITFHLSISNSTNTLQSVYSPCWGLLACCPMMTLLLSVSGS